MAILLAMPQTTVEADQSTLATIRILCATHRLKRSQLLAGMTAHFASMSEADRAIALIAKPTASDPAPAATPPTTKPPRTRHRRSTATA